MNTPNIQLSKNQTQLHDVNRRLKTLKNWHKGSPEIARIEAARDEVLSRMDGSEIAAYEQAMTRVLTPAEKKAQAERERLAMEANRDKPSI